MFHSEAIECDFCRKQVESVEDAIGNDWLPSYFDGEDEQPNPVCPDCAAKCLRQAADGEMELVLVELESA